jgi:hypothetical protein
MKRIWLCAVLAASMAALAFAQGENRQGQKAAPEKIVINGALGIAKGSIALKSGNDTYYVMGLNRFVGFIDGLKEGAQVSLEGYAFPLPNNEGKGFKVAKLTLNGKDYDLGSGRSFAGNFGNGAPRKNFSPPPPRGPGPNRDSRQLPQRNAPGSRWHGGRK